MEPPRPTSACSATAIGHAALGLGAFLGLLLSAISTTAAPSAKPTPAADAMALLHRNCLACHGPEHQRGGLSLATRELTLKGGDSGRVIAPGKPDRSPLLKSLGPDADPHMPPKRQLAPQQIELVRRWIETGAKWDDAALARLNAPREIHLEALPAGHQPVQALALSPDGKRLAIGRAGRLSIHDLAATNQPVLQEIEAHPDLIHAMAWSPDGRWIATGGFREIHVWSATNLASVWSVSVPPPPAPPNKRGPQTPPPAPALLGRVTALRFSPQSGALIAADGAPSASGWVRLYAAETGQPLGSWMAHADTIYDLSLSPDGGLLATAGGDKLIKTWELVSQKEVARLEGHSSAVMGVAFNTNANELVSVGADKQLKLWDLKTREATVTIGGRKESFTSVAWSANGTRVVTGDDAGQVHSFSEFKPHTGEQSSATATERRLGAWPEIIHAVAISADGKSIFAGGQDGVVRALSSEGTVIAQFQPTSSSASASTAEIAPSFVGDVLPILAKAGCSAGSCHARADGQNGFKLSVFSYDPKADYAEIVKEARGRRVFPSAPDESLLLLKATATIDHGGGQRIETSSDFYTTLARWIRGGMVYQRTNEPALAHLRVDPAERSYKKGATQPLKVLAEFSDGTSKDVTRFAEFISQEKEIAQVSEEGVIKVGTLSGESVVVARYLGFVDASRITVPAETTLPAERLAALPRYNFIDDLAYAQFQKLGLFPSDLCSDAEFLRRAYLDLIGVLPTPEDAREFLQGDADNSRERRAALVERLLQRPEFGDFWANKWADLLRPNPDRVGVKSVFLLDQWLRDSFRANKPYDAFAREIITAEGSNHRDGPIVVYRDRREPPELATMFSQLFLGVRLECAKCHHHPNEKWSQDDFYQMAAVFRGVHQKGAGLSPPISAGSETFYAAAGGSVNHPVSGVSMKPRPPDGPWLEEGGDALDPRQAFARWLTAPENPFFARAIVNRVWASLFGRGFVEPVDDFRVSNPPSNGPLLDALSADFARHGFDAKHLLRTITSSRLYQLSSTPNDSNLADTRNYSRSYRRRLPAETLLDAVNDITGVDDEFNGCPPGTRAMQTWSYKVRSQFLDAFGRPNSSSDCPCERDVRTSVVQALHMMNSRRLQEKLAGSEGRVNTLAKGDLPPDKIVTELYLATLSRYPSTDELQRATAPFAADPAARRAAIEDVLWALLNSAEFVFNH
ncbi:MAG: DUF1553 domain-containing protein [Verrucomicrobiales bacterium]|nr:DUF1553 domain-containing protein [Verrucomicrobiales bacterium]